MDSTEDLDLDNRGSGSVSFRWPWVSHLASLRLGLSVITNDVKQGLVCLFVFFSSQALF